MAGVWGEYTYSVETCRMVTPVIAELWLSPVGEPIGFAPGQYVLVSDPDFRVPQRSYSIANAPREDGAVSLLVTAVEEGVTSRWACRRQPGDEVLLEGPFGTFVTDPAEDSPVLLLGAGSGLAPVRALAESLLDSPTPGADRPRRPVTLFFSCRTAEHEIDVARFRRWENEDVRVLITHTRDPGSPRHARIPELLPAEFADLAGWEVFAAGPSGFVQGCAAAAGRLGADATRIHTEEFFVDPQPWGDALPPLPGPAPTGSAADR